MSERPNNESRPARFGWSPGNYYCQCKCCGWMFTGDKRAFECAECAYSKPDPSPNPMTTDQAAIDALAEAINRAVFRIRSREFRQHEVGGQFNWGSECKAEALPVLVDLRSRGFDIVRKE